jgi:DNA repair exonuclease SbcCD ATPase subunit
LKTISVKEAAAALGLTPRAVSYRLEKGQLKGTLSKNETTGVPEWRIYPNKEILSVLSQAQVEDTTAIDFEPNDVIEAESVSDTADDAASQQSEARPGAMDFQLIVEQCVRPLVEEVKAQALALAEKDRIIEDQSRQLRLLPDFQKRAEDEKARAEEERKAAELRALEIEALNKQVAAMEEEKQQLESKANEATALANDLEALKQTVEKLQTPWWKKLFGSEIQAEK